MPNGNLLQFGNIFIKIIEVFQAQVVAGIHFNAYFVCKFCCFNKRLNSFYPAQWIKPGVRFGVEFNPVGTGFGCTLNGFFIRINKNRVLMPCS